MVAGAGMAVASLPVLITQGLWTVWFAALIALLLAFALDVVLSIPPRIVQVDVLAPELLYIGSEDKFLVQLRVGPQRYAAVFDCLLEVGERLERCPVMQAPMSKTGTGRLAFVLKPVRRGTAEINRLATRWTGPMGLMRRDKVVDINAEV